MKGDRQAISLTAASTAAAGLSCSKETKSCSDTPRLRNVARHEVSSYSSYSSCSSYSSEQQHVHCCEPKLQQGRVRVTVLSSNDHTIHDFVSTSRPPQLAAAQRDGSALPA